VSKSIIYIYLLDEGVDVWRPTEGEEIADMIFKVLPTQNYDPEDEHWEYPPGTLVHCSYKTLDDGEALVAVEKV